MKEKGYAPLWLDDLLQPGANARDAMRLLKNATDDGLEPGDYHADQFEHLAATRGDPTSTVRVSNLATLDLTLSSGMLRYFRDVHMGRLDPRTIGVRMSIPADRHDFAAVLRSALAGRRILQAAADLRPSLAQYADLRAMLARYRSLEAEASLDSFPSFVSAVRPGQPYAGLASLRRQLSAFGDLPDGTPPLSGPDVYQGTLVEGVKRFQQRHGLESDGVIGKATFAELRVPLEHRVRQIELALERLRWLPHLGDHRLIVINIPMFRLWSLDAAGEARPPSLGMAVIVGRALSTQTPVFVEEMREVIFRPYWNVPRSILRHEILPMLKRDSDYLRRQDMEIVRGAGDNAHPVEATAASLAELRQGTLRVRQRPGPRNSLGLVKFVFPNEENVYLHGTPAQALFSRSRRDFSHGCVRVEDPVALAEWVLQDRPEWTRERILSAMAGTQSIRVNLPRLIQVVLFYTTAAVMPEDGTIRFAEDIYRHDARLDRALMRRHSSD